MAVSISVYGNTMHLTMDTQRYGHDRWQLAFLYIDTMHLTMDTHRHGLDGWQLSFMYIDTMHITIDTHRFMGVMDGS
jgi:hypothetical protein